jgi:hypothetical protein
MDWEFFEDGLTIMPISVGFVCEDGRELYMVNAEANLHAFAVQNETGVWLRKHVLPTLPVKMGQLDPYVWDTDHPHYEAHVFSKAAMRAQILHYMRASSGFPELWANYGAFDMVCLKWLWGNMRAQDPIMPWYCNDLQQLLRSNVVNPASLPQQDPETEHNALGDARHLRDCYDWASTLILNRRNMVRYQP